MAISGDFGLFCCKSVANFFGRSAFVPQGFAGFSAEPFVANFSGRRLFEWQARHAFWKHMVKKNPDLERGESASETGRTHIPPRLFKEAVRLNRMKDQIMVILNDSSPFNKKAKAEELEALRRTVEVLAPEILQAAKKVIAHKPQER